MADARSMNERGRRAPQSAPTGNPERSVAAQRRGSPLSRPAIEGLLARRPDQRPIAVPAPHARCCSVSPLSRTVLLQIFVAERSRVVALVRRIVGCRATAEDLAQETLLRLWGRPVGTEDRSLLFRTAQNLAIDHLRERRVRVEYARAL